MNYDKIVCIDDADFSMLSIGKIYEIRHTEKGYYLVSEVGKSIINFYYPEIIFKKLEDIRDDKINQILNA